MCFGNNTNSQRRSNGPQTPTPPTPAPPIPPALPPPRQWDNNPGGGNQNGGQNGGGGGNPSPKSLEEQILEREKARQDAVRAGNTNIDTAFSRFNDPFYSEFADSYKRYYNPQIDTQYGDAQGTLEAGLARRGIDRSTMASSQFGRLFGQYADQRAAIGDKAASAVQGLKGQVNEAKGRLYQLNAASADPAQASTQALASATALVAPPAFSPLGSMFANFLQPYTAYANAYSNNAGPGYTSPYSSGGSSGSVVR